MQKGPSRTKIKVSSGTKSGTKIKVPSGTKIKGPSGTKIKGPSGTKSGTKNEKGYKRGCLADFAHLIFGL